MDPGDKTQLRIAFQMQTCTDKAYAMKKKRKVSLQEWLLERVVAPFFSPDHLLVQHFSCVWLQRAFAWNWTPSADSQCCCAGCAVSELLPPLRADCRRCPISQEETALKKKSRNKDAPHTDKFTCF